MIGLTGERGVGKSTVVKYLELKHNFENAHAFNVGKHMTLQMLLYMDVPYDTAYRMVYTDLRDVPSSYLPGKVSCRYFMEKFGFFMGKELGPEWTLGAELKHLKQFIEYHDDNIKDSENAVRGIVFDSIVYEAPLFKEKGGIIIRITRPDADKTIEAPNTSKAQAEVKHDVEITNDGSLDQLHSAIDAVLLQVRLVNFSENLSSIV